MIERRLDNLLALDYPGDRLEIVVASDASSDRTNELVEAVAAREPRVRLLDCPRGGKVAAQDRAVRETASDVVAFSDANATWAPDALRQLVANLADPEVAYVCGRLRLEDAAGSNREGLYWRYELWLREQESRLGSITGGNGSIYALEPRRLRRGRSALGARPRLPLPDGAGGPPRGLRARRARVREADADERGRVRPQGADVRALLGDHAARLDAAAAAAGLPRLRRLASPAPLRQRGAPPRAARNEPPRSRRPAGRTRSPFSASSPCSPPSPPASRSRGTTSTSRGRPSRRSGTTSAAGFRPPGRPRRGRAETCPEARISADLPTRYPKAVKTSIDIDRELSDEVAELLGTETLRETVHQALLEARGVVLRRRLAQRVLDGTLPVPTQEEYEELRRPRLPVDDLATPPRKRRPTA